jgi:uncharacterized membrane protein
LRHDGTLFRKRALACLTAADLVLVSGRGEPPLTVAPTELEGGVLTPSRSSAISALALFAILGVAFAAFSTHDYVSFLDRQVHAITCSYVPGLSAPDVTGSSGCHAVLMSPYSALFRTATWGGIPIALPALAVFAYLLFRAGDILLRGLGGDRRETFFMVMASLLPLGASLVYLLISLLRVGATCKVCVGIYVASAGVFLAAVAAHRRARKLAAPPPPKWGRYTAYFLEGIAFVVVPTLLYLGLKPAYAGSAAGCGELVHAEDRYHVRIKLAGAPGGVPAIEVMDPLCPACKAFSQRLEASGLGKRLNRELLLFPLDKECNWMVSESLHPGACVVSEAVLCGGNRAGEILQWAFDHQEELRQLGRDPSRLDARIRQQFPQLADCLGRPAVRARLNRSLRWAVANSLPVVTPQLFVRGVRVCDEDTDLGLDFVLTRMLAAPLTGARTETGR